MNSDPHGRCPAPGCCNPLPGRFSAFCAEHYFAVDLKTARFVIRMKIERARAKSDAVREHCDYQIAGYVQQALKTMKQPREGQSAE